MARGYFITFEGGEGAGKTTLALRIRDALQALGKEVIFTREPGGTAFGEELRHFLLHRQPGEKVSPKAQLFLFLASRIQHLEEVIKPALARGSIVLCDRFSDSTIAYQGRGQALGLDYVLSCSQLATNGIEPDLTFFLDVNPEVGLERIDKRAVGGPRDRMEQETVAFHERVHTGFLELAKKFPKRIIRLDGSVDPNTLFESAYVHLKNFLQK
jgi:dTMP kinase